MQVTIWTEKLIDSTAVADAEIPMSLFLNEPTKVLLTLVCNRLKQSVTTKLFQIF